MSIQDYSHPALTVDVVLFATGQVPLEVLLIQRESPPFEQAWAFPGGFVDLGEAPEEAARRELAEETDVRGVPLEQVATFGDPGRDPRGHVVTVAFLALVPADMAHRTEAGSDAARTRWWPVDQLPPLAFDHHRILRCALRQLRERLTCIVQGAGFVAGSLTMHQLRAIGDVVESELGGRTRSK